MKTDGQHFANRMQATLEEAGLHPIKAAYVRDRIIETAEAKGWPEVSRDARARISCCMEVSPATPPNSLTPYRGPEATAKHPGEVKST